MSNKTCFFIGNRNTPREVREQLAGIIEKHITEYGVTAYTVGNYGNFDRIVQSV